MPFFKTYRIHIGIFLLLLIASVVSGSLAYRHVPHEQPPTPIQHTDAAPEIAQAPQESVPAPNDITHVAVSAPVVQTAVATGSISPPDSVAPVSTIQATLVVDGALVENGYFETIAIPLNSTIYDMMMEAHKQDSDFHFTTKSYKELGQFIESINGLANDPSLPLYWTLYINDKRSALGASNYTVQAGDTIHWKFENINNT